MPAILAMSVILPMPGYSSDRSAGRLFQPLRAPAFPPKYPLHRFCFSGINIADVPGVVNF